MTQNNDINSSSTKCVNCEGEVTGKYCQECGQKQGVPRLTVKGFFKEFLDKIYGLDGTFPKTIIGLTLFPGRVIKEYIKGVRRKYVGPAGYYFLLFAIYLLTMELFNISLLESVPDFNDSMGIEETEKQKAFKEYLQRQIFDHMQFFTILQFPFIAWWSKLFFRKATYNFLERMVFVFYANAHSIIASILLLPLLGFSTDTYYLLNSVISVGVFSWCTTDFFYGKKPILKFIKGIFLWLVSFLSFVIAFTILTAVIIIIYINIVEV